MNVVVISRDAPSSWDRCTTLRLKLADGEVGDLLLDYHGERAFLLHVECATRAEALVLESEASDPDAPFFEWDACPIRKQIDDQRVVWSALWQE